MLTVSSLKLAVLRVIIATSVVIVANASDIHPMSLNGSPTRINLNQNNDIGSSSAIGFNDISKHQNNIGIQSTPNTVISSTNEEVARIERRQRFKLRAKRATSSIVGLMLVSKIYENRNNFPSKDQVQNYAFEVATNIKGKGHMGILYYIFGLACCETFGVTTCPIEISGGFVYGIRNGFCINAGGKILGSMIAYTVGRTFLSSKIQSKLLSNNTEEYQPDLVENNKKDNKKSNEIMKLVQTCVTEEPFTTALVLRFSFFPQLVKNLMLSIMEPIHWRLFIGVYCLQVLPFTLLFTCVGYDSAQRLRIPDLQVNYILSGSILLSTLYGVFGAPSLVAFWYHKKSKKFQ